MNLVTAALRGLPEYNTMLQSVEAFDSTAVTGLSSIHRAHLISALRKDTGRPILAVCQDDLAHHCPFTIFHFACLDVDQCVAGYIRRHQIRRKLNPPECTVQ